VVSLGKLGSARAIPALLGGLRDANRLVRLRAAEGLVSISGDLSSIFDQVVQLGDRYGLHAFLAALDNADLRGKLETELQDAADLGDERKKHLREALRTGVLSLPHAAETVGVSAKPVAP
jgi:HEAT repeat protein